MDVDPWGFDVERQAFARRLRTRRVVLALLRDAVLFFFLLALLAGESFAIRDGILSLGMPRWAAIAAYLIVLFAIASALSFPFAYVNGFLWEARAGLSSRTLGSWLKDLGKSVGLTAGLVVLAGEVILWLLVVLPGSWWIAAWGLGLVVSLGFGALAPILLVPLFYRLRPIQDAALRARFEALASAAGMPVLGVYQLEASAKTRRSNAAVMGYGRTRRIVVTDTLLREYASEEIDSVLAHELAHQKHRDPWTGFAFGALSSFFVLGVAAAGYGFTYPWFGIPAPSDVAGLPLLALYAGIASAVLGPLELWASRRRERSADRFALELTWNPQAFASAMVKLHDKNLGVAHPRWIEVWLFYSHPPGRDRVDFARAFAATK